MAERLSPAAAERLANASAEIAGLLALGELAELLDPDGTRGRWRVAGDLAARLSRFEAGAWPRIRAGYREPRDRLESLLAVIAASSLPRSRENIWRLLT